MPLSAAERADLGLAPVESAPAPAPPELAEIARGVRQLADAEAARAVREEQTRTMLEAIRGNTARVPWRCDVVARDADGLIATVRLAPEEVGK